MGLYAPKREPRNWYLYDVAMSIDLLRPYIDGLEAKIVDTIADFESNNEMVFIEGSSPEEDTVIPTFRGIDGSTWHLDTIVREYFPDLQRQSGLITLFSFLEHELDGLCILFNKSERYRLELGDIRGKGIDRATLYLEKVVGLDLDRTCEPWREIKAIQGIRNLIVHSGAKLTRPDGGPRESAKLYVSKSQFLYGDDTIHIQEGYLVHVLSVFNAYFQDLDSAIHRHCGGNEPEG